MSSARHEPAQDENGLNTGLCVCGSNHSAGGGEYVRKRKEFKLVFEDEGKADLEVRAVSTSMGKILGFMDLAAMDRNKFGPEERDKLQGLFVVFMKSVRSWNLFHEVEVENEQGEVIGEKTIPTPRTAAGLQEHDPDFVLDLVFAWMDGILGTPGPLGRKSEGGVPSEEASIPMETSYESPTL